MIQTKLYFNDIWKQKLKQVNVPKIGVERIEVKGSPTPIYTQLGLNSKTLPN